MSTQVKKIQIVISDKTLEEKLCWFQKNMGEYAVRTYVIKKPGIIAKNLELQGINVQFYKYKDEKKEYVEEAGEADIVFRNNKTYYIVETKRFWQYKSGWEQVKRAVECFRSDAEINKQDYDEVIAVLVTTDPLDKALKKEILKD